MHLRVVIVTKANTIEEILSNYTVSATGCWLHNLTPHPKDGYIRVRYNKKKWLAHRLSYEYHKGLLGVGMCACHTCDTRRCINPEHLFEGTLEDNVHDMVAKGRNWVGRGECNPNAVLTLGQVNSIKARTAQTTAALAREYGVDWSTIARIRKEVYWK